MKASPLFHPFRTWQAWQQLSWFERRLLIQALVLLPLMTAGLRLLGFSRLQRFLVRWIPREVTSDQSTASDGNTVLTECRNIARIVDIAVRHVPYPAACLPRSLLLWWLLGREGIVSDLRLGARKVEGQFEAHAWVEYHGAVLNDTEDVHQRFSMINTPAA